MMRTLYRLLGRVLYYVLFPAIFVYVYRSRRVYAVIRVNDEVLLIKNWLGSGKWTFAGGGVAKGEAADAGLVRELAEELGVQTSSEDLQLHTDWTKHKRGFFYRYYEVRLADKPMITKQWEISEYIWVRWDEIGEYLDEREYTAFGGRSPDRI